MSPETVAGTDAIVVECIIPILNVANLAGSLGFYTGVLGFKVD